MTPTIEIDVRYPLPEIDTVLLREVLFYSARNEPAFPAGRWSLAVRLTDDLEIAALHARYFDDAAPTDVIKFPFDHADSGGGHLGDIIISVDTAGSQAVEFDHSLSREIAFLGIHGLLHLCGYEDVTVAQREAMLAQQERLLAMSEAMLRLRL